MLDEQTSHVVRLLSAIRSSLIKRDWTLLTPLRMGSFRNTLLSCFLTPITGCRWVGTLRFAYHLSRFAQICACENIGTDLDRVRMHLRPDHYTSSYILCSTHHYELTQVLLASCGGRLTPQANGFDTLRFKMFLARLAKHKQVSIRRLQAVANLQSFQHDLVNTQ